jgi:hypothetical protein
MLLPKQLPKLIRIKKAEPTPSFFDATDLPSLHGRTQASISAVEEQTNHTNDAKASNGSHEPKGNSSGFRHDQYLFQIIFIEILIASTS